MRSHPDRVPAPDVWILGGFITWKDLSFPPLGMAWIVQAAGILLFNGCVWVAMWRRTTLALASSFLGLGCILLASFPFWMMAYVDGGMGNSDGLKFFTHFSVGWLVYGAIVWLTIKLFLRPLDARPPAQ